MGNVDGDGFGALWGLLVERARSRLVTEHPKETAQFLAQDHSIEEGPAVARKLGLKEPYTKALEAGVACREAISRIAVARQVTDWILSEGSNAHPHLASLIIDSLRIYIPAYIDSVERFIKTCLGQLVPEDQDTTKRREELGKWVREARRVLSLARQTVAHAETGYVSAITEDGLWVPAILLGVAGEDMLVEMLRQNLETDASKFEWRAGQLLQVALMALAQGEAQMEATAKLIASKLPPPPDKASA